jgi:hypothetical protein
MREDLLDVPRIVAVAVVVIEIATITELEGDAAQRDPEDGQKNDGDEAHPQPAHAAHANTNRRVSASVTGSASVRTLTPLKGEHRCQAPDVDGYDERHLGDDAGECALRPAPRSVRPPRLNEVLAGRMGTGPSSTGSRQILERWSTVDCQGIPS